MQAGRHDPDPCRRRWRRPDRVPMGKAPWRDRDRHRRQRREGRGRARAWLRPCDRLRRGGFRRARARRSPAARACRWSTISSARPRSRIRCAACAGAAILASFGEASGDPDPVPPRRLGQLGSIYLTHPSLGDYTATREELLETANDLFDMVMSGKIRIDISTTYPLPRRHVRMPISRRARPPARSS